LSNAGRSTAAASTAPALSALDDLDQNDFAASTPLADSPAGAAIAAPRYLAHAPLLPAHGGTLFACRFCLRI
jgi:hypothetical protein